MENEKLKKILFNKKFNKKDLIILSDYGHGFLSPAIVKKICKKYNHIYLNAQLNASNIGYHTIRNYKNFNTLIINEKEIRHEMRDKINKLENLMSNLSKEKNINNLIVTMGKSGSILYNKEQNKFFYSEAYAHKIVDKVGAGDTMLSIIGPCLKSKLEIDTTLLISSLAAAQSVETMGNKDTISKIKMLKTLQNILK